MDRRERLAIIVFKLKNANAARNFDEAMTLIAKVMNETEDQYSGVTYNQANSGFDGRLYPPHESFEKDSGILGVRMIRTRGHSVFIAMNGAIRFVKLDGAVVLDKPGEDGEFCPA